MSDLIYSVAIEEFQKCEVKHMSLSILYMINHGLIDAQSLSREEDDGKLRISMGSDSDLNQGSLQKKDAQTFRNKEVGMSLNGGGLKRIRVAVVKTLLNKGGGRYVSCTEKRMRFNGGEKAERIPYPVSVVPINEDLLGEFGKVDKEEAIFNYFEEFCAVYVNQERTIFGHVLYSMSCQDEVEFIELPKGVEIVDTVRKHDFICICTNRKIDNVKYVVKSPPLEKFKGTSPNPKVMAIVNSYLQNVERAKEEGSEPKYRLDYLENEKDVIGALLEGRSPDKRICDLASQLGVNEMEAAQILDNEEWLDAVFECGTGACRDRVLAVDNKLKKAGLGPTTVDLGPDERGSYRLSRINNNHIAIEVASQDSKGFVYVDLGGSFAHQMNIEREKKLNSLLDKFSLDPCEGRERVDSPGEGGSGSEKKRKSTAQKEEEVQRKEVAKKVLNDEDSIAKYLQQSRKYQEISKISEILEMQSSGKSPLLVAKDLDMVANSIISEARKSGRQVFYIDSLEKIDIFKQVIAFDKSCQDLNIYPKGFLASFLEYCYKKDSLKPSPLLLVNWDVLNKAAFNTIIDEIATIQGYSLKNIPVIGLSSQKPKDDSFLTRQELFEVGNVLSGHLQGNQPKIEVRKESDKSEYHEVDFEGFNNWKQKLLGVISLSENKPVCSTSDFTAAILKGKKNFLIKNISPEGKKELEYFFKQAKAFGYFEYHSRKIPCAEDLQVQFTQKAFDFAKFYNCDYVSCYENVTYSQATDCHRINTQNFDILLHSKDLEGGYYSEVEGLVAQYVKESKPLNLHITSTLSAAQYYCLLNWVGKCDLKLNLFLAPAISLPQEVKSVLEGEHQARVSSEGMQEDLPPVVPEMEVEEVPPVAPEIEVEEAPPVPESLNIAKVIVTNHAELCLKNNPDLLDDSAIILDIEDYSCQDLIANLTFDFKDNQFSNFQLLEGQLIDYLRQGRRIVLKGEFSTELLQMIQDILVQDFSKNLTLIVENCNSKVSLKQLSWLDGVEENTYSLEEVNTYRGLMERSRKIVTEEDPDPTLTENQEETRIKSATFIENRKSVLKSMLEEGKIVCLAGESGVGKSSLMREYAKEEGVRLYNTMSEFLDWAKDVSGDEEKILFLDEINTKNLNFTIFSPLTRGGNPIIYYLDENGKGVFFELTSRHKLVCAKNDKSYGNRHDQKLFDNYPVSIFELKDFPANYIYQDLLKEKILKQSGEEFELDERAFYDKCKELIEEYQAVNSRKANSQTVRELQEFVLRFMVMKKYSIDSEVETKTENFVSVDATKSIEDALSECLLVKHCQRQGSLPSTAGLGGVLLKGGSGIGKSSLIEAVLQKHRVEYQKIDASEVLSDPDAVGRKIIDAFDKGKAMWFDEFDSCMGGNLHCQQKRGSMDIEEIFNSALNGIHPVTKEAAKIPGFTVIMSINGGEEDQRGVISPAMTHRMYFPRVSELGDYSVKDFKKVLNSKGLKADDAVVQKAAQDFSKIVKAGHEQYNIRSFIKSFKAKLAELDRVEVAKLGSRKRQHCEDKGDDVGRCGEGAAPERGAKRGNLGFAKRDIRDISHPEDTPQGRPSGPGGSTVVARRRVESDSR